MIERTQQHPPITVSVPQSKGKCADDSINDNVIDNDGTNDDDDADDNGSSRCHTALLLRWE